MYKLSVLCASEIYYLDLLPELIKFALWVIQIFP